MATASSRASHPNALPGTPSFLSGLSLFRSFRVLLVGKIATTVLIQEESGDVVVGKSHCLQIVRNPIFTVPEFVPNKILLW